MQIKGLGLYTIPMLRHCHNITGATISVLLYMQSQIHTKQRQTSTFVRRGGVGGGLIDVAYNTLSDVATLSLPILDVETTLVCLLRLHIS